VCRAWPCCDPPWYNVRRYRPDGRVAWSRRWVFDDKNKLPTECCALDDGCTAVCGQPGDDGCDLKLFGPDGDLLWGVDATKPIRDALSISADEIIPHIGVAARSGNRVVYLAGRIIPGSLVPCLLAEFDRQGNLLRTPTPTFNAKLTPLRPVRGGGDRILMSSQGGIFSAVGVWNDDESATAGLALDDPSSPAGFETTGYFDFAAADDFLLIGQASGVDIVEVGLSRWNFSAPHTADIAWRSNPFVDPTGAGAGLVRWLDAVGNVGLAGGGLVFADGHTGDIATFDPATGDPATEFVLPAGERLALTRLSRDAVEPIAQMVGLLPAGVFGSTSQILRFNADGTPRWRHRHATWTAFAPHLDGAVSAVGNYAFRADDRSFLPLT
jgi:hypothetical protein